jgi:hypothetical protein
LIGALRQQSTPSGRRELLVYSSSATITERPATRRFSQIRENPLKFRIRTLGLLLGSAVAYPIGICDCGKYMAGSGTGVPRADLCGRGAMPLYVTASERRVVILRVFTKKTRRTPRREIELARRRAEEVT